MTTEEIKNLFGIDITKKDRSIPYIALRYLYAENRTKEIKGNVTHKYKTVASEIKCNRDNIYNMLIKVQEFKKDRLIKLICKAFKTKDKTYLDKYFEIKRQELKDYNKKRRNEILLRSHVPAERKEQVVKIFTNKPLLTNLQVAEFLRNNKLLKHELWDIPTKNISPNQWQKLRSINKTMFDSYVN